MRIEALTFFRFFAALIVVIFHYGKETKLVTYAKPFIISGPQMVSFFFVLSGFVLMISHYNKKNETFTSFYASRAVRLAPIYIISLLLTSYFTFGKGINNIKAFVLSLTFLQSWFPPYPLSINSPAWAMSVEVFFYISFPLILLIIKKCDIKPVWLILFSLSIYIFTQSILSNLLGTNFYDGFPSTSHDLIFYFPLSHACSFLLGVAGGYVCIKNEKYILSQGPLSLTILIVVLFSTYLLLQYPNAIRMVFDFPIAFGSSFYGLIFLILILSIAFSNNFITRLLSLPIFIILGEASYSMYILQQPLRIVYRSYIAEYLTLNKSNDFYAYLVFLITIAIATLYLIEKPFKNLLIGKKVRLPPKDKVAIDMANNR